MKKLMVIILGFVGFISCVRDKPNPDLALAPSPQEPGVWVLNEGSFGNANAELSFIHTHDKTVSNGLYKQVNGTVLGDVAQSMIRIHDSLLYIAVNNSNTIEVVAFPSLKKLHSITVPYPRQMLQINDSMLWVSSLYNPTVYILNTNTQQIDKQIAVAYPNTEHMLRVGNEVWICNWNANVQYIDVIQLTDITQHSSFPISGKAPQQMLIDANHKCWILSGNVYENIPAQLAVVDIQTKQVERIFSFSSKQDPLRLFCNSKKDQLYVLMVNYNGLQQNNGLYRMSINDSVFPATPFIRASAGSYFWNAAISPDDQQLFVSDPKGFTQRSAVYEYNLQGSLLHTYIVGIGANQFLFP